jgi:LPS sulfotransferase NodH
VPDLLAQVFPNLHYIWISRQDKVRQAISLWRALQTWTWKQEENASAAGAPSHPRTLIFNFQAIDYLVRQIVAQEAAWQHYFSSNGIQPYTIVYEEFASSYEETALSILQYLNIPLPQSLVFAQRRMKQQSDTLSEEWVQRYHQIKQEQTAA